MRETAWRKCLENLEKWIAWSNKPKMLLRMEILKAPPFPLERPPSWQKFSLKRKNTNKLAFYIRQQKPYLEDKNRAIVPSRSLNEREDSLPPPRVYVNIFHMPMKR